MGLAFCCEQTNTSFVTLPNFRQPRRSFQHHGGKVCGKAGHYCCNRLLTNRFNILHCNGCEPHRSYAGPSVIPTARGILKTRLDKLLVERGLTPSRERAQALILAGKVLVNEQRIDKAGASIGTDARLRLLGEDFPYVSRGGLKLERALDHWQIDLARRVCLDVGASTGGFTDCMLQRGSAKVIAVDTGYGQLDLRLRNDPRVRLLEKTNARYLTAEKLYQGEAPERIDFIAMDVSFISATMILPALIGAVNSSELAPWPDSIESVRHVVILVKPQFEVGRELVGKGGIVRNEAAQQAAVKRVEAALLELGASDLEAIESPILGAEGNREFLLHGVFAPNASARQGSEMSL
jgi:23S rRNA (cytidine1920-2'-O)/16S rRNA (cytidine1409-2'-O)-methyltransferase